MRRIDALGYGVVVFLVGGAGYLGLKVAGVDNINAGIWSQLILVAIVIAWIGSYLFRVASKDMTYNQQLKDYEEAVLQKRLEELTPAELAKLQAEIDREQNQS